MLIDAVALLVHKQAGMVCDASAVQSSKYNTCIIM